MNSNDAILYNYDNHLEIICYFILMEQFACLLQNQSALAKLYKEQQKEKKKEKSQEIKDKKYYGNSAEYRRDWYKNGANIYK